MSLLRALPAWFWLVLSVALYAAGESYSKRWGLGPSWKLTAVALLFYVTSSLVWLPVLLHKNEILTMGLAWLLLATVATVLVGAVAWGEPLTPVRWVGIASTVVALALLSR